jgi:hypothetical protein
MSLAGREIPAHSRREFRNGATRSPGIPYAQQPQRYQTQKAMRRWVIDVSHLVEGGQM